MNPNTKLEHSGLWKRTLAIMLVIIMVTMVATPMVSAERAPDDQILSSYPLKISSDAGYELSTPGPNVYNSDPAPAPSVAILTEGFDGGVFPPAGWSVDQTATGVYMGLVGLYWDLWDDTYFPVTVSPPNCAGIYWGDGTGLDPVQDERLRTPSLDLSTASDASVTFMSCYYWDSSDPSDFNDVEVSTDGGGSWTQVADLLHDATYELGGAGFGGAGWNWNEVPITIDLTPYCGFPNVQVAWHYYSVPPACGNSVWFIDDVLIDMTLGYGVDLQPPFQQDTCTFVGEEVDYPLTVTNIGAFVDTYDLSASGNAWPVTFISGGVETPLLNPSFETGDSTNWIATDVAGPYVPMFVGGAGNQCPDIATAFLTAPTDGIFSLQHGFDGAGPGNILLGQDYTVPYGAPTLTFDYRAAWDLVLVPATIDRTFSVHIEPAGGGAPLQTDLILTAVANTQVDDTGILQGIVDLSPFMGSTIYIDFDWWVPETNSGPAYFELDNIQIVNPEFPITQIGPIPIGDSIPFIARVTVPGGMGPGDFDPANIMASSQTDPPGITTLVDEQFEGAFPPAGWTVIDNEGTGVDWRRNDAWGDGNYVTGGADFCADSNSDSAGVLDFDTELWTPSFDLSTATAPVLSYDANYQNLGDILDVDISTDGGGSWTNLLSWNEDHGGFFSTPSEHVDIDLSAYIGQSNVIVRWHYFDPNSSPDWNWYVQIDNVQVNAIMTGTFDIAQIKTSWPYDIPWTDDMESGPGLWTTTGFWHQVQDGVSPYPNSYSPVTSWWYGQDSTGDYDNGFTNSGRLESPWFDLTGYTEALISFEEWFETEGLFGIVDQRYIQYDTGSGWTNIQLLPEDGMNTWHHRTIDLTPYCGQIIRLGFYFDSVDNIGNNFDGWYVDDVYVGQCDVDLTPDLQIASEYYGNDVDYVLTVDNTGVIPDTYDLSVAGNAWPTTFWDITGTVPITDTGVLAAGASFDFIARVSIPILTAGMVDTATIIATSQTDIIVWNDAQVQTTSLQPYGVSLFPGFQAISEYYGNDVDYVISVDNTGVLPDTYDLTVAGNAWPTTFWDITGTIPITDTGVMAPGTTLNIVVRVSIPILTAGMVDTATITATSQNDPIVWDTAQVQTTSLQPYGVDLNPVFQSESHYYGDTYSYTLTIDNTGVLPDTYDLTVAGNAWPTVFSDTWGMPITDTGSILDGGSMDIVVEVSIPILTTGIVDTATITATSQHDPVVWDTAQVQTTSLQPYGVQVTPNLQTQSEYYGNTVEYTMTVENTGVYVDTYDLTMAGNAWPTTIWNDNGNTMINSIGPIQPGNAEDIRVTVDIPLLTAGVIDTATLTATSQNDPVIWDNAQVQTTSMQPYNVAMSPNFHSGDGDTGTFVTYDFIVFNIGTLPDNYDITFWGNGWPVQIMDATGSFPISSTGVIMPGATFSFQVWVFIPANIPPGWTDNVNIRVTSQSDPVVFYTSTIQTESDPDFWFNAGPPTQTQWGWKGDVVYHTITVTNDGAAPDVYLPMWDDFEWEVEFWDINKQEQRWWFGPVQPGDTLQFLAKVRLPRGVEAGDVDIVNINVRSNGNEAINWDLQIITRTSLPSPFYDQFETGIFGNYNDGGPLGTVFNAWETTDTHDGGLSTQTSESGAWSMYASDDVTLTTCPMDMEDVDNGLVSAWIRSGASFSNYPEANEDLFVEYLNDQNDWVILERVRSRGAATAGTVYHPVYQLPHDAYHNLFQLRFRQVYGENNDDYWHIDDVYIGPAESNFDLWPTTPVATESIGNELYYDMHIVNNARHTDIIDIDIQFNGQPFTPGLFIDDFSDGNYNGWNIVNTAGGGSSWTASSGIMSQLSNIHSWSTPAWPGTFAWTGNNAWSDYVYSGRFASADNDGFGIMGRYQNTNNYYRFQWHQENNQDVDAGTPGTQHRSLEKCVGGTWTTLASDDVAYIPNQSIWYDFEMRMIGDQITVSIDGVIVFDVTDNSLSTGGIGLYSWGNTGSHFDDIFVYGPGVGPNDIGSLTLAPGETFDLMLPFDESLFPLNEGMNTIDIMATSLIDPSVTDTSQITLLATVHNQDKDTWHSSIQKAVDIANPNDNILAYPGTYRENVVVDKPLTIQGQDRDNTIVGFEGGIPDVLLLFADAGNGEPLRSQLLAFGDITVVDTWDARYSTPTLAQLQAYDVVITWGNYGYNNPTLIGDNLADYVDSGGKVITAMFSISSSGSSYAIQGRFKTDDYHAIAEAGYTSSWTTLGVYDASHPIMDGVVSVNGFYRSTSTTLNPNSYEIARWADGRLFVASKNDKSVVAIAEYPGQARQWTGDVDIIFHNTILWMGGSGDGTIFHVTSDDVNINGFTIQNADTGVLLDNVQDCTVFDNTIKDLDTGILLLNSDTNTITINLILDNGNGITSTGSNNNQIFHNDIIGNGIQATDDSNTNAWDVGYPSGGNFWSDYGGVDANNDQIGDTPYIIDGDSQDNFPIMNQYTTSSFTPPVFLFEQDPVIVTKIDSPGVYVDYTITIRNTGNVPDTYDLAFDGNTWTTEILDASGVNINNIGPIQPGDSLTFTVRVTIPALSATGDADAVNIKTSSQWDPTLMASDLLSTMAHIVLDKDIGLKDDIVSDEALVEEIVEEMVEPVVEELAEAIVEPKVPIADDRQVAPVLTGTMEQALNVDDNPIMTETQAEPEVKADKDIGIDIWAFLPVFFVMVFIPTAYYNRKQKKL
ncbi:MAG: hypothetical protein KAS16_03565 [Thermoplasmata archaeon]|nr:hypothetical protein [Thermoplasmata archaeon]